MAVKQPFARVDFPNCRVEATADGAGGFVVRVWQGTESLLAVHVPPADQKQHAQYWTATEWGGLLTRKLWADISKKESAARKVAAQFSAFAPAPVIPRVRKWGSPK